MTTDCVIIGAGAAGLMAAATAGEYGLRAVLLERRHQPGRKLLMCGNNRCNITNTLSADKMLQALGEPVSPFLEKAINLFDSKRLCCWFSEHRLQTKADQDGRVYPTSEMAADVLHAFTDSLRDLCVPLILNSPVMEIQQKSSGFLVKCLNFELSARTVIIATGGVSYPKTGSVGDGQKFAKALGHKIQPYRAGLSGIELEEAWLGAYGEASFPDVSLTITSNGQIIGRTRGNILCGRSCFRGAAMVNASRLLARQNITKFELSADLAPAYTRVQLINALVKHCKQNPNRQLAKVLAHWLLPPEVSRDIVQRILRQSPTCSCGSLDPAALASIVDQLKDWHLHPTGVRPLKEAMVTVGGVSLSDIDPETMQSRRCPGLFFAGEVMDIDGPTGGFNLQAAFSTARLAVTTIATQLGKSLQEKPLTAPSQGNKGNQRRRKHYRQGRQR